MRQSQLATPAARISLGVVPVNKGGTGATTIFGAVLNLGGLYIPNLDLALYVAKLLANGKVNPIHLPDMCVRGPTLNGLTTLYQGQLTSYQITNYDSNTTYTVGVSAGTVVALVGNTLTYRAPTWSTTVTLTINGKSVLIPVEDPWPLTPTVVASTTGTVSSATGVFTGSAFAMTAGVARHRQSDWQLASDVNFTNIVQTSEDDNNNLTGWNAKNLAFSATYYVRVRYRATNGEYSDWSPAVLFTTAANYTPDSEEAKIVAADKAGSDNFGWAVAIDQSADRIAVGAYQNDEPSDSNCGAVYIFKRTGSTWAQETRLEASAVLSNNTYAGFSVAMDSTCTRVIAGAYGHDGSRGCVLVWLRTNTTWTREAQLTASDANSNDRLGWSVSCDATCTYIAAGAPRRTVTSSSNAGSVCVFQRTGTSWSYESRIVASDKASNDYFGWSVAVDGVGQRLVVGAYQEDPGGTSAAGSVYVYANSGGTVVQEAKFAASDKEATGWFGYSVAINYDGTRIAVGANQATVMAFIQAGAVYVFNRAGTTWTQSAKLTSFDREAGDFFGCSVAINATGDKIAVGANGCEVTGLTTAGAAYVFTFVDGSIWVQDSKLTASDKALSDQFGISVAISGEGGRAVVGAWQEDPGGTNNAGSAYVYS